MSLLSPNFVIGTIRIGSIDGASCLNMGNNYPTHFQSQKKQSQGFGSISGDQNKLEHARAVVIDSDLIDMMNASDQPVPDWLKDLIYAAAQPKQHTPGT